MDPRTLVIDSDITRAQSLPAELYTEQAWFERLRERVLPRAWHLYPRGEASPLEPWNFLEGSLDVPLLLTRTADGGQHCISNACTHRGNILVDQPCRGSSIRCGYHGRRFALDGTMMSAPGFDQAVDFPGARDHLAAVPLETWDRFIFASLNPAHPLAELVQPMIERVSWLPLSRMRFIPERSRHYDVRANWALYCDNYLEGFHIPYVHASLTAALDWDAYRTELLPRGVLQIGMAAGDGPVFDLPPSHPDFGQRIAAYYFWLFPTTMFNVYPWGISINVVLPQSVACTRVVYLTYVWDTDLDETGAGAGLHYVEQEDEVVVESCMRGTASPLYERGRYSPRHERGVHHFHRMLVEWMR